MVVVDRRRGGGVAGEPAPDPVPPRPSGEEPWLIDSREVGRLLGIGQTKTRQMLARSDLPTVRIGRCVRVSREALRSWLAEQPGQSEPVEPIAWIRSTARARRNR